MRTHTIELRSLMVKLKPGTRYRSIVCPTEVVVVVAPAQEVSLECGGHPMVAIGPSTPPGPPAKVTLDAALAAGTTLGKRYTTVDDFKLELLCTKSGEGTLVAEGNPLQLKDSKALPSSD